MQLSALCMLLLVYPCRSRAFTTSRTVLGQANRFRGGSTPSSSLASAATNECSLSPLQVANFGGIQHFVPSKEKFRVVFVLGGPGSGKGTQSELMKEHYPVSHQSVGQLLRDVDPSSPDAQLIAERLKEGQIVPVEVSLNLLRQAMQQQVEEVGPQTIFLVDGFPRNFDNLQGWCQYMDTKADVWSTFVYQCPLDVLQERILQRGKDSGRSDDNLESLKKRFRTFEQETVSVIDQLRQSCNVVDIAGDETLDDVWLATQQLCNQLILNDILHANQKLLDAAASDKLDEYVAVCDPVMFRDNDAATVMKQQEGDHPTPVVANAEANVITGHHMVVTYDRVDLSMRETRAWVHQGRDGWRCVHLTRVPL